MTAWLALSASFAVGGLLAAAYLGGLWLTVRDIQRWRHPASWLLASFFARAAVLVAVLILMLGDGHWERLLAAVAGFVVVRALVVAHARRAPSPSGIETREERAP